ncbi:MAG: septal ring lytic transglycosylase RlpA family protein [Gammaproteobacteria bacterium]|nr:septal ring lytic transglycosylase RlpA family protein [Gammaproteobacteria bacterium]MDH3767628.1 septal ring lytic transglycosylase RlpA family protein [Gammaproteobacteria bacterium]
MKRHLQYLLAVSFLSACVGTPYEPTPAPSPSERSAKTSPYEVFGQTYYPIADAGGYRERGVASWYGGKFHGRQTANGERYDMHQFTAAHKTLPLPTLVRVTNLRNGAVTTVRVNDRGPFAKNRLIDLSYAAALQLGMVDDGTTLVEVEVIDATMARQAQTLPVAKPTTTAITTEVAASIAGNPLPDAGPETPNTYPLQRIYVQVGAFGELTNAQRIQTTLYNAGIGGVRIGGGELEGIPVYRVQIGPVTGVADYDMLITQLDSLGISDTHLVTE